jgi:hypothetical protein
MYYLMTAYKKRPKHVAFLIYIIKIFLCSMGENRNVSSLVILYRLQVLTHNAV